MTRPAEGTRRIPVSGSRATAADWPARRGLRIGIDATCLASGRGYGRFLRELLPCLLARGEGHEVVLFIDRASAAELGPLPARTVEPPTRRKQAAAASARGHRSLADLWTMGRAVAREPLDCMFFPSVYSYFPVLGRVPIAVAIHDAIPERLGHLVFPSAKQRWLWRAKVAAACRQARAILTVSEWSRRTLVERLRIPPERISVAPEAPAPAFAPAPDPAPRWAWLRKQGWPEGARYLLSVGGFNPHKNLGALVDAFAALLRADPACDLRLLLVGDHCGDVFHADVGGLRRSIEAAGLGEQVLLAGFVPDAELRHVYAGALALVLPSLEEGFGLSAVEAAACGTPCVATRNSPLPELLQGGGLFVDPTDPGALRGALERLWREPAMRARLGSVALERAGALRWEATADAVLRTLERIGGAP